MVLLQFMLFSIVMVTEANKVGYIRGVLIAPSTGV
jgi:hypothetical protein